MYILLSSLAAMVSTLQVLFSLGVSRGTAVGDKDVGSEDASADAAVCKSDDAHEYNY